MCFFVIIVLKADLLTHLIAGGVNSDVHFDELYARAEAGWELIFRNTVKFVLPYVVNGVIVAV